MYIIRIIFFLIIVSLSVKAQVGNWKSYTDMKNIRDIVLAGTNVWAATSGGVFRYDLVKKVFSRFTNIDGIATIDVTAIASDEGNRIYVGSSSGYINIYDPPTSSWSVIPDIARAISKPQRGINKFVVSRDKIYIATDFGVVEYSPSKKEFGDTYLKFGSLLSPVKVNDIFIGNNSIWVATDKGIATAALTSQNLQEPSNWTTYTKSDGLPVSNILSIISFQNTMIVGTSSGASFFNGSRWQDIILPNQNASVIRMSSQSSDEMFLVTPENIFSMRSLNDIQSYLDKTNFITKSNFTFVSLIPVNKDSTIIGSTLGISFVDQNASDKHWSLAKPNGPNSNQFIGLMIDDQGILWSASGRDAAGHGIYSFDGTIWTNYTVDTYPVLLGDSYVRANRGANGSRWFNAWGAGLLLIRSDGSLIRYSAENVPGFPGVGTAVQFNVTDGTTFDSKGTTWSIHYRATDAKVLSAFTRDSSWFFFENKAVTGATEFSKVAIDIYGTKWMIVNDQLFKGLVTFNDRGTLSNLSDDKWDKVSVSDPAGLDAGSVTEIAIDLTGDIWIGTDIGLRTIFNPNNPQKATKTCNNTRCNIEGQYINSIAIDALNNKWLGTRSGVFVLTPDGSTIVAQYSTQNSPLLDNDVKSIVVHPKTGVAYFGTDKGLSSLQTSSVQPNEEASELKITPNPFRPQQDGNAVIDGLVEGATLKILSIDGSVIADVETPGGRIGFWDGKTNDGQYAPTGIYIIAGYNFDGSKVGLGKIAVIR